MTPAPRLPFFRWRGLTWQIFVLVILPLSGLLLLGVLGSVYLHEQAMRDLVGERDQRAVRIAVSALEEQLRHRAAAVQELALRTSDGITPQQVLAEAAFLYSDFDTGLAVFSPRGQLLAATNDAEWWTNVLQAHPLSAWVDATFSPAFPDPLNGDFVVLVAGRSRPDEPLVLGAFHTQALARHTLAGNFSDEKTNLLLVDTDFQVLYAQGSPPPEDIATYPGVAEALRGESGSAYVRTANGEHVVTIAPIMPVRWALVSDEPWQQVANQRLQLTQYAPLLLIPLLLFSLLALSFGARQIIQPLQALEERATALGWGDFKHIRQPVGGIEEIRRLQNELINMAEKVERAQQGLHGYIGAITRGQEEERHRLARELHDETIQALIALNQRVQLTRLKVANNSSALASLDEIQHMTQTLIANLRRLTRALRPLYLEDLGLVAALEMLTRQNYDNVQVAFRQEGVPYNLPAQTELALYRIAQEGVNNAIRHAAARHIQISLRFEAAQVVLMVQDDGRGFSPPESPAELAPAGHFGLLGMHERAALVGAHLKIHSAPKQGTLLVVTLPTPQE